MLNQHTKTQNSPSVRTTVIRSVSRKGQFNLQQTSLGHGLRKHLSPYQSLKPGHIGKFYLQHIVILAPFSLATLGVTLASSKLLNIQSLPGQIGMVAVSTVGVMGAAVSLVLLCKSIRKFLAERKADTTGKLPNEKREGEQEKPQS